ncbi:Histone acetyltransferase [Bertholletia excelsa]
MLVQSSVIGTVEPSIPFIPNDGKDDWILGNETQLRHPKNEKSPHGGCKVVPVMEEKRNIDDLCSLNLASSCSQLSSVSTMSESSMPAFVYQRRKPQRNTIAVSLPQALARPNDGSLSAISSRVLLMGANQGPIASVVELESEVIGAGIPPVEFSREAVTLKSESVSGCLVAEDACSKGALKSGVSRALDFCSVNDSYSSSKSNMEIGSASLRTEMDDTGECSSSSALLVEDLQDNLSERDICISIIRSQGLLEGVWPIRSRPSVGGPVRSYESSCMRICEVCCHSENTSNMLICDQCEEAFHVSCCNPHIRKIPEDEWFCQSCMKKKHKILNESAAGKELNISTEMSRNRSAAPKEELGPIASVLETTETYTSGIRIGQDFQADVPDWSGPSIDEVDAYCEPLEIKHLEWGSIHGRNSRKSSRLSSIGNWLQCREVLEGIGEGVDGTICGKWRRAPLFEVQTDNWECFCAVLWDPAHADCAVPQEVDTDEVLRQLRYVDMLRPRLAAKRRKLDRAENENVGSQNLLEDVRSRPTV